MAYHQAYHSAPVSAPAGAPPRPLPSWDHSSVGARGVSRAHLSSRTAATAAAAGAARGAVATAAAAAAGAARGVVATAAAGAGSARRPVVVAGAAAGAGWGAAATSAGKGGALDGAALAMGPRLTDRNKNRDQGAGGGDRQGSSQGHSSVTAATRYPVDLHPLPRSFPPLPEPVLPAFQKFTLANGLRVILLEDPEMGLVEGQLCVRGGAKLEPASQVGLASVLSSVQRSGGTGQFPEEKLDDLLEDLAASVETGSTSAEMDVGFQCLRADLPTTLDIFAQVTLSPLLPASKLELVRSQALGSLARRNDNPGRVAGRKMRQLLYGRESPYGRSASAPGISSIALQDLRSFHSLSFCDPSQAVLGVWGDIDPDQVLDLLDRHLGPRAWTRGFRLQAAAAPASGALPTTTPPAMGQGGTVGAALTGLGQVGTVGTVGAVGTALTGLGPQLAAGKGTAPTGLGSQAVRGVVPVAEGRGGPESGGLGAGVPRQSGAAPVPAECDLGARARAEGVGLEEGFAAAPLGFYGVDVPGLTQGYVRLGELGSTFQDDDVFALDVLNSILNGFGGRLFDKIRSQQGLAYSVSGAWSPSLEHRGTFVAGGETQLGNVFKFVAALTEQLYQATLEPPTSDELQRAKDAALNSFVFNFSSTGAQMQRILSYELYGIPQDFPFQYRERVEALTQDDILQAAQRWLHPEEQRLLVVSDFTQLRPELDSYGLQVQMLGLDD